MTDPISIPALRTRISDWKEVLSVESLADLLALVEAVEALRWSQEQIGWDPGTPPADALARFDFGEDT